MKVWNFPPTFSRLQFWNRKLYCQCHEQLTNNNGKLIQFNIFRVQVYYRSKKRKKESDATSSCSKWEIKKELSIHDIFAKRRHGHVSAQNTPKNDTVRKLKTSPNDENVIYEIIHGVAMEFQKD